MPLGRTIGVRRQRRGLEPLALAGGRRLRPASRAARAAATTSSTSTSRWSRSSAGTRRSAPSPGRRHLPRLLDQGDPQPRRDAARRPPHVQSALGADRRLRGRRLDRPALVRRPLRDHPQRGRPRRRAAAGRSRRPRSSASLFVGRAEERKGLPILLSAFGALAEHVPCRLTVIGAERDDVAALPRRPRDDALHRPPRPGLRRQLWRDLHDADLLCAPSLSGESFGMVLTEAFAAGTPVIASAIAGYSDVVTDGRRRRPRPARDPQRLAEELQRAYHEPERLGRWARRPARAPSATPGRASPTG